MPLDRRRFLARLSAAGFSGGLFPGALYTVAAQGAAEDEAEITVEMIEQAEQLAGLSFTPEQRAMMRDDLQRNREGFREMRAYPLVNSVAPALQFDLRAGGATIPQGPVRRLTDWSPPATALPGSDEDLAYLSVAGLASLLKTRKITSLRLTQFFIDRLKRYDERLHAVITLTEERALAQARAADRELDAGRWRGPLHGVPWGAKDLLSVRGYRTTWGAAPYRDQEIDADADVVRRLDDAGAVLVAKLTLGALAMGDVWFDDITRNPWNLDQGSSGSSAGPGSAVSAGLVPFAIGSETLGSIVSPSTRNGITGLRPTFGRVSKGGAMALSWSMDKLGPMCRSAEDCALVFDAIHGRGEGDATSYDAPFAWDPSRAASIRVGYLASAFEEDYAGKQADAATLDVLRSLGYDLKPIALPDRPIGAMRMLLIVEAAASFDALTRSGRTDWMVRQTAGSWPNSFRQARFIPAVEYVQANRHRTLLMRDMEAVMADVDVFVSPSFGGGTLLTTNLTGHPAVCVPNRFDPLENPPDQRRRAPGSITFIGGLFKDAETLAVAHAYQQATDFHLRRPALE
ncbi:MAG: amidase [Rhodothermales bacterium]